MVKLGSAFKRIRSNSAEYIRRAAENNYRRRQEARADRFWEAEFKNHNASKIQSVWRNYKKRQAFKNFMARKVAISRNFLGYQRKFK